MAGGPGWAPPGRAICAPCPDPQPAPGRGPPQAVSAAVEAAAAVPQPFSERDRAARPGPGPRPARRAPERSLPSGGSRAAPHRTTPRRSSGSLPARRRQRRPRRCCSCGAAVQVPREPGDRGWLSAWRVLSCPPRREATLGPRRRLRERFARGRRSPFPFLCPPARSPPARAHTRASHTAAPRTAPPRTPRATTPAADPGRHAPPAPRPPRPMSSPPWGVSGLGSVASAPGCGGRAASLAPGRLARAPPAPRTSRRAVPTAGPSPGAGRRARGARGGGSPGDSPTRGSCCPNAGARPSRALPRPARPRAAGRTRPARPRTWLPAPGTSEIRAPEPSPRRPPRAQRPDSPPRRWTRQVRTFRRGRECRLGGVRGHPPTLRGLGGPRPAALWLRRAGGGEAPCPRDSSSEPPAGPIQTGTPEFLVPPTSTPHGEARAKRSTLGTPSSGPLLRGPPRGICPGWRG